MKFRILSFLLLAIFCLENTKAQEKHALIIALSQYPESSGWPSISSFRDVPLISEALKTQGFKKENISVLTDEEGTRKGILASIENLTSKVKAGDVVVFHFSGHGQQIPDNSGDENDGLDEAIVPIDGFHDYAAGKYEGENHIRDDELGLALAKLRARLGPTGDLMVILDSCHSGTATRGKAKHRGSKVLMAPIDYQPIAGATQEQSFGLYGKDDQLAPMVCFSASRPNQLNWEAKDENGNNVGALTLAISKTLMNATSKMTYRGLFDEVRATMAENSFLQTPQIEGNLDQLIFAGQAVETPPYFQVVQLGDSNSVTINGGRLHGLLEKTEISFYPIDTRNINQGTPITTGKVVYSDLTTADLKIDDKIDLRKLRKAWGFVTNRNFGSLEVGVSLGISNGKLQEGLVAKFSSSPFISTYSMLPELFIEPSQELPDQNSIQLITSHGQVLGHFSNDEDTETIEEVFLQIAKYAQVKFLRSIHNHQENLAVKLNIIPVSARKIGRRTILEEKLSIADKRDKNGRIQFQKGDHLILQLINYGDRKVYVSLLDIQPDNEVNILLPRKNESANDYLIEPGDTLNLDHIIWQMAEPFGTDIFKLITTQVPLNLAPILISRGSNTKGDKLSPFEELFRNTFLEEQSARGLEDTKMPPSAAHIENTIIEIVPRN